jgi:hypothetical protein
MLVQHEDTNSEGEYVCKTMHALVLKDTDTTFPSLFCGCDILMKGITLENTYFTCVNGSRF